MKASQPEGPEGWTHPLTDGEIGDLLGVTLHGPLPQEMMVRVFATLALVPELRRSESAQERERAGRMAARVHQLEKEVSEHKRRVANLIKRLGEEAAKNNPSRLPDIAERLNSALAQSEDAAGVALKALGPTKPKPLRKRAKGKR